MAYIKITSKYTPYDGMPITFEAPCDCNETEGVRVGSKNFAFADAHGSRLHGVGNLFSKGAVVKVILNTTDGMAYIQNADTNSYLEFSKASRSTPTMNAEARRVKSVPDAAAPYARVKKVGSALIQSPNLFKETLLKPFAFDEGDDYYSILPVDCGLNTGISFKENTQYTLSYTAFNRDGGGRSVVCLCFIYADGMSYWEVFDSESYVPVTLVSQPGRTVVDIGIDYGQNGSALTVKKNTVMLNEGTTALPYEPYVGDIRFTYVTDVKSMNAGNVVDRIAIPGSVQELDGYGWAINYSVYNYIDFEKKQFVKRVGRVDLKGLTWNAAAGAWWTKEMVGKTVPDKGLCDSYSVIPTTSTDVAADKTIQIRGDGMYVKDAAVTTEGDIKGTLYYELATPVVTDISNLIHDNLIDVEGGGTVTFVTPAGNEDDMPNEVLFYDDSNEVIGANTFVGNLDGVAGRAVADKNGNDISTTYLTSANIETLRSELNNKASIADLEDIRARLDALGIAEEASF